jgi:PQQ-dependent dehydrogenase (s-GDH family)
MLRHLILAVALIGTFFQTLGFSQQPSAFRVVATGLGAPWEITWGPDGFLWVTERTAGRVVRINPENGAIAPAVQIAEVYPGTSWHEGLLGMALHPDLLKSAGRDYVYLAYTYDEDPGAALSRKLKVRRYTYNATTGALVDPLDIVSGLPAHDDHGGGRLIIGPDQKLYLSRGDNGANWLANACLPNRAQDLPTASEIAKKDWSAYEGKILRLNLDGSIPSDNPTLNGVRSHVYSYGHRNPQGLVFGPTGLLYESEHGPGTDDEVNLIIAGANYGWPHIAGYRDDRTYVYTKWSQPVGVSCASLTFDAFDAPASVPKETESAWKGVFQPPLRTFFTADENYDPRTGANSTIAPSSLELYAARANGIPGWANSLLLPGMTRGRVYRMKLSEDGRSIVGANEELFRTQNRYRDLAIGPDARTFYLATDPAGMGRVMDMSGASVLTYANPGAILAFTYPN